MNFMNNSQNPTADWRLQDYTAILFDCDGTLADTMPAHYRAWLHVTKHHGIVFDEDYVSMHSVVVRRETFLQHLRVRRRLRSIWTRHPK